MSYSSVSLLGLPKKKYECTYRAFVEISRYHICPYALVVNEKAASFGVSANSACPIALVVTFRSLFSGESESAECALEGSRGLEHGGSIGNEDFTIN